MLYFEEKVPGGKLVRISIDQGKVTLSGDFFIYPEDGILLMERVLSRMNGQETVEEVEETLLQVTDENRIKLVGFDERVIARLFTGAAHVAYHRA